MINLKLRLQNKTTLIAIIGVLVALVYQILGLLGIVVSISQNDLLNVLYTLVNALVLLGVIIDPTTKGVSDSTQAMEYTEPK